VSEEMLLRGAFMGSMLGVSPWKIASGKHSATRDFSQQLFFWGGKPGISQGVTYCTPSKRSIDG